MSKQKRSNTLIYSESDSSESDSDLDSELKLLGNTKPVDSVSSSSSENDEMWKGQTSTKRKKPSRKTARTTKKAKLSSSDSEENETEKKSESEEGEVSKSGGDSEDSSDESLVFNDGFDESFFGDAADRARLAQLSEKEREEEIFRRLEKREALRTRFEIERKLRKAKEKLSSKNVKSGSSGLKRVGESNNATQRSIDRRTTVRKECVQRSALEVLAAKRKKNAETQEQRKRTEQAARDERKLVGDDIYSDDDKDSDEEEEEDEEEGGKENGGRKSRLNRVGGGRKDRGSSSRSSSSSGSENSDDESSMDSTEVRKKKAHVVETKEELSKIRLSRFRLGQWCHMPFFKKTVLNCFVRIGIGNNPRTQKPVYRVAEIVDVCEGPKVYQLGPARTNITLKLKYCKSECLRRMEFISDSPYTDSEFAKWRQDCVLDGVALPTSYDIESKIKDINVAIHYRLNDADVDKIVSNKMEFRKNPVNCAKEKTRLLKELETAEQAGQTEKVKEIKEKMVSLEERALMLHAERSHQIKSISFINQRNRMLSIQNADAASKREVAEALVAKADPFTRRQCRPTLVTKSQDPEIAAGMKARLAEKFKLDPVESDVAPKNASTPLMPSGAVVRANVPTTSSSSSGAVKTGLHADHDFDININIFVPMGNAAVPSVITGRTTGASTKTKFDLSAYKKKKGLI